MMRRFLGVFLLTFSVTACLAESRTLLDWENAGVKLPFASDQDLPRVIVDREIDLGLNDCDAVHLELEFEAPSAIDHVSLSLKSGNGWYSCSVNSFSRGRERIVFPRWRFGREGTPGGFDKIDTVRISFWRGNSVDTSVKLLSLKAITASAAIIVPNAPERTPASRNGVVVRRVFEELGLPFRLIRQDQRNAETLQHLSVAILPWNDDLSPEDIRILSTFMNDGGKIIAFGFLPGELRSRLENRGVFFNEAPSEGDFETKKMELLQLLGRYDLHHWRYALEWKCEEIKRIGRKSDQETGFLMQCNENLRDDYQVLIDRSENVPETPEAFFAIYMELENMREKLASEYVRSLPGKPNEFRAWWEHAGMGPYGGDWDRTIRELSEAGFNALITNSIRGGLAHYESDVLPQSAFCRLRGDQIAGAVAAGKKYGVEIHIWKVCFNASDAPAEFLETMRIEGRMQKRADGTDLDWLCPSHPENRKLECATMLEAATKYDIDGIHFDYIRYPDANSCFCEGCRERFDQHLRDNHLEETKNWPDDVFHGSLSKRYVDWRCDQITCLVRDTHDAVKGVKPSIKISAAVLGRYPECRRTVLQDWPLWIERGYLDFICPMDYTDSPKVFAEYIESQNDLVQNRIPLYPGIGATAEGIALRPEEVALQIDIVRAARLPGWTIYNLEPKTIRTLPRPLSTGPTK